MATENFTHPADLIFSKESVIRPYRTAAFIDEKGCDFFNDADTAFEPVIAYLEDGAEHLRAMAEMMSNVSARMAAACRNRDRLSGPRLTLVTP